MVQIAKGPWHLLYAEPTSGYGSIAAPATRVLYEPGHPVAALTTDPIDGSLRAGLRGTLRS